MRRAGCLSGRSNEKIRRAKNSARYTNTLADRIEKAACDQKIWWKTVGEEPSVSSERRRFYLGVIRRAPEVRSTLMVTVPSNTCKMMSPAN